MKPQKQTTLAPWIIGIAAGLYPVIFYYTNNYSLINSWEHLGYFTGVFLVAPVFIFFIVSRIASIHLFQKIRKYVLPFLNIFFFLFYLKLALYAGINWGIVFVILVIALIASFFLYVHFKKIIQLQLLLAFIGLFYLVPTIYKQLNYSKEWMQQPDDIEEAIFIDKPNIYFIQPDGYANFNLLKSPLYNTDNSLFENFLEEHKFTKYPDFRNNYGATLPSNSSVFMMKHHYYNKGSNFSETINARDVIVGENSVLKLLKNNGYYTSFIAQRPYFLISRAPIAYDRLNFSKEEISFITSGLEIEKDVNKALEIQLNDTIPQPTFTFIQLLLPGHIKSNSFDSKGVEGERQRYLSQLKSSNEILTKMINSIIAKDPEAMIIMMADHGGYVGLEYTKQTYTVTDDVALRNSIFGSALAIKWPSSTIPSFNSEIKSSVNLFRMITAYLSKNESYLTHLENDNSYIVIKNGAPKGIYSYLDENGEYIFKRYNLD